MLILVQTDKALQISYHQNMGLLINICAMAQGNDYLDPKAGVDTICNKNQPSMTVP